ncbi:MAG: TetR/AcrR family transcriptional regulator [Phycisphaerales bacterium]|nr:TetR/AcrR family transcriptional regulator [Phycisphaerales bacterium]
MPRPSQLNEKRRELLPRVARAFAELGYRRATTAELAARCGVQENILYRLWPDKKAMFVASIHHVYESSLNVWKRVLAVGDHERSAAEQLLGYEAEHHGEFGLYRILFTALGETDDPEIRAAAADTYRSFHTWIARHVSGYRKERGVRSFVPVELAAWAIVGLGTVSNIGRQLDLLDADARARLMRLAGRALLGRATQGRGD